MITRCNSCPTSWARPWTGPRCWRRPRWGSAWLAGQRAGAWPGMEGFAKTWAMERQFTPAMEEADRSARYDRWKRAVGAVLSV
jgi:glycerol kinase